ncbi:uncharacterized protein LOC114330316 [Diabrotica virgifera virgifera]|uniref:Uncharacterized protein n=1 Tax=Diabrotica virgifera virgifera TaxID=50390 RepID=A0ABM5IL75_DIAVI|nr:uncharacterized protein LOC114330316 [Diabrotica virgifera virgifera]
MEEPVIKKKSKRKIRSTQDFNEFNRMSLLTPSSTSNPLTKSVTKKKNNLFYLPKVDLNLSGGSKENCSPNIVGDTETVVKKSKKSRSRKKLDSSEESKKDNSEIQPQQTKSGKVSEGFSTEEDKRDSEVEFKKKRRRKRKSKTKSGAQSSSEISSNENEVPQAPTDLFSNNKGDILDEIKVPEGKVLSVRKSNRISQGLPKITLTEEYDSPQKIDHTLNKQLKEHGNKANNCFVLQRGATFIQDTPSKSLVTKTPKKTVGMSKISNSVTVIDKSLKRKSSIARKSDKFSEKQPQEDIEEYFRNINNGLSLSEHSSENIDENIPTQNNFTHISKNIIVTHPTPNKGKTAYKTPLKLNDAPSNLQSVNNSDRRSSVFRKSVHQSPLMRKKEEKPMLDDTFNIHDSVLQNLRSSSKKSIRLSRNTPNLAKKQERLTFDKKDNDEDIEPINTSPLVKTSTRLSHVTPKNAKQEEQQYINELDIIVDNELTASRSALKKNNRPNGENIESPNTTAVGKRSSRLLHAIPKVTRQEEQVIIEPYVMDETKMTASTSTLKKRNRTNTENIESTNRSALGKRSIRFSQETSKNIKQEEEQLNEPYIKDDNELPASRSSVKKSNRTKIHDNINDIDKSSRNGSILKRKSSSRGTEGIALTPISSEYLSDDVFTSRENLSETVDIGILENAENDGDTFELENSIFVLSELPVVNNASSEQARRSKSLCGPSKSKSVSFMTPNLRSKRKTSEVQPSSSESMNVTPPNGEALGPSLWYAQEGSKIYPKSPHSSKVSSSSFYKSTGSLSETGSSKSVDESSSLHRPPSEYVCKKRKTWNRSLGVSILDDSGILHSVSPPWEDTALLDSSGSFEPQAHTSKTSLSPIKHIDSPKESFINSTKKSNSTKKVPRTDRQSSPRKSTVLFTETISPIKQDTQKHLRFDETAETNKQNKSGLRRIKLPNFARIHQKAYDKLENLKEMSERKALRAQQLLSGKKPKPETSLTVSSSNLKIKSPTLKIKSPKSRKLLRYSPKKSPLQKPKKLEQMTSNMLISKTKTKVTPSKSSVRIVKPVEKKVVVSKIPKAVMAEKKGLSRLGFKAGPAGNTKGSRVEQIKAAASKAQPKRNSLENRREVVQKVRTNRRFELLMKMRNANG